MDFYRVRRMRRDLVPYTDEALKDRRETLTQAVCLIKGIITGMNYYDTEEIRNIIHLFNIELGLIKDELQRRKEIDIKLENFKSKYAPNLDDETE